MPWTSHDRRELRRLTTRYETDTATASALGIAPSSLSRYLTVEKKPHGKLAETALREKIASLLSSGKRAEDLSSMIDAES